MREVARFTTDPHSCPYLSGRQARQRVRIIEELSGAEYDRVLEQGWRRFGSAVFRPDCEMCTECVSLRVDVSRFRPTKSQRRVLRRNRDVEVQVAEPSIDLERLELYRKYHEERSERRGWCHEPLDPSQYFESFLDNAATTWEFRYSVDGQLIAIAYVGEARNALNSIYAFSDPEQSRRSLGTFDILTEVAQAKRMGKRFLYLGYRVSSCPSMAYKSSFRPNEVLERGQWGPGDRARFLRCGDKSSESTSCGMES